MRNPYLIVLSALGLALCTGCMGDTGLGGADGRSDGAPFGDPGGNGQFPDGRSPDSGSGLQCDNGRSYTGIGGRSLTASRIDKEASSDRRRVKSYAALETEFPRVLGNTPQLLSQSASTYGAPAARWYEEPQMSAVTLFTSFRIAFQGCLTLTANGTQYAAAPTPTSAAAVCTSLATRFWSREPQPAELDACVRMAATDTASETNARRRWAYACATLLSTSGFLSY